MRGVGGTGETQDSFYYNLGAYIFELNQKSPFPIPREQFFTVYQEIVSEIRKEMNLLGADEFLKKIEPCGMKKL